MRVLILGGGGMLGHKLWQRLPRRFPDTFVTLRQRHPALARSGLFNGERVIEGVDATDFEALDALLARLKPQTVINCIAVTKRREQADDPVAANTLNALLPHRLHRWARANEARLINFSTDCVFAGATGNYTEASTPDATDVYGRTKALGEIDAAHALTLRLSIIGREIEHRTELLEWFLMQDGGEPVKGFRNALYTGVSTLYLADLVAELIERFHDLAGLYQVAAETISKYDLLLLARAAFGVDVAIEPVDRPVIRRNLNGERFRRATGCTPPPWREMMAALAADPTPYAAWRTTDAVR